MLFQNCKMKSKMLKVILAVGILLIGLFAVAQIWMKKVNKDIEMYSYKVVKTYP